MSAVLSGASWLLAVAAGAPLAVFSMELLTGLWPSRRRGVAKVAARTAVLIPAHDEAAGIGSTLAELFACAPEGTRVLVVADNCTDATASVAREVGAEVVERHDPGARGKGYALAFGRDHLAGADGKAPDVVVVLDADCRLLPGSVIALTEAAMRLGAPVQAVNLIAPDLAAPPMVQISSFAMLVKNLYRSRGMQRLGGGALLTGTGMAFPWKLFADADLATGSIVEDLSLGIGMTRAGHAPRLIGEAGVRSAPADITDALAQRTRWEHGFLQTLGRQAIPTLLGGLRGGSLAEILLGLHLAVPPLALLLTAAAAALAVQAALALLGGSFAPVLALGLLIAVALVLVVAAWMAGGRQYLGGAALLRAPLYLLWKLPLYARFLRKPEGRWTRTPRRPQ